MSAATTDLRAMFDSKYIGAWDCAEDITVTILRVAGGTVEGEAGRKDRKPLVYLKGWPDRPLVLNKTNLATVYSLYGTYDGEKLVGKRLTLYATTCKAKGGGTVPCVRIRPTVPTAPGQPQPGGGV